MDDKNDIKGNKYTEKAVDTITEREKINTDGRNQYDWESHYPSQARKEMLYEAIYIAIVLVVSLLGLFLSWCNIFNAECVLDSEKRLTVETVLIYLFAGLLGGTVYGIKYFYRVVARGYWSQDRRYWRIFSPWISSCVALIVGCMVISGFINSVDVPSNLASICIGFVAGYFADDAVSKMSEVAKALFGTSSKTK